MTSYDYDPNEPDIDLDKDVILLKDGTRLTNEVADQIVEDTHQQLRGRGRPTLDSEASEGQSPVVRFRVPEQMRRQLNERAAAEGRNPSEVARDALERYLNS